jgi:hypothetical protein
MQEPQMLTKEYHKMEVLSIQDTPAHSSGSTAKAIFISDLDVVSRLAR